MLNFKRSLLVVVGLLCALCFAACGGAAKPTDGVAGQGDANSNAATVTVVPTAQPQKTAEAVKVQSQNQQQANQNQQGTQNQAQQGAQAKAANNGDQQAAAQSNAQAANNGNQQAAQSNAQAGDQNMQQNAAPQNNSGGSGTVVASTQVNVNGQMMNVLTTGTGLALYYRSSDPAPGSSCTGDCAKSWPPFIAQGNVIPADNFQGQLTTHATANGNQVEYNGHPLYTYSGDNAKGQLNGQGLNGVWNAVTIIPQKQHW